jgi:hypothetical protein
MAGKRISEPIPLKAVVVVAGSRNAPERNRKGPRICGDSENHCRARLASASGGVPGVVIHTGDGRLRRHPAPAVRIRYMVEPVTMMEPTKSHIKKVLIYGK